MTCPAMKLANKIEVHLKLDETPGYHLTNEDQQMIIDCLRFTSMYEVEKGELMAYVKGLHDANNIIGALWSDLFNKDLIRAEGSDYFDKWRGRIRALAIIDPPGGTKPS
jgi:hypothetical protein